MDTVELQKKSHTQFMFEGIKAKYFSYCLNKMEPTKNIDYNFKEEMNFCLWDCFYKSQRIDKRLPELEAAFSRKYEKPTSLIFEDNDSEDF